MHDDVKKELINDVRDVVKTFPGGHVHGIIISGDIAYSAAESQYRDADHWLGRLAEVAGCPIQAIQVVPGNHDVDRDRARSHLTKRTLMDIADRGESELDAVLRDPSDRELFYERFQEYRNFAVAYGCPLDADGGNAGVREVDLAPNRTLQFIGLNTALTCGALDDEEGKLLLGARQHVVSRTDGKEVVFIGHHPLHWLQDSDEAGKYIRARARVLMTGHEHKPSVKVERVGSGCDVLMLGAGATIPPGCDGGYTYTYNFLQFSWDAPTDGLQVKVMPRVWSDEYKAFCEDISRSSEADSTFKLGCPNFERGAKVVVHVGANIDVTEPAVRELIATQTSDPQSGVGMKTITERYAKLRLRFFRELNAAGRLAVLVRLGALPEDWAETLAHPIETRALEKLLGDDRLNDLENAINQAITKKI